MTDGVGIYLGNTEYKFKNNGNTGGMDKISSCEQALFDKINEKEALATKMETISEPKEASDQQEQEQIKSISNTLTSVQNEYSTTVSAANIAAQNAQSAAQNANSLASALGAIPQQIPTEDGKGTQENPAYIAAQAAVAAAQQQAQALQQQASELQQQAENLQSTCQEIQNELNAAMEDVGDDDGEDEELAALKEQIEAFNQEIESLESELEQAKTEYDNAESEYNNIQQDNENENDENSEETTKTEEDGSTTTTLPDGREVNISSDGTATVTLPDGKIVMFYTTESNYNAAAVYGSYNSDDILFQIQCTKTDDNKTTPYSLSYNEDGSLTEFSQNAEGMATITNGFVDEDSSKVTSAFEISQDGDKALTASYSVSDEDTEIKTVIDKDGIAYFDLEGNEILSEEDVKQEEQDSELSYDRADSNREAIKTSHENLSVVNGMSNEEEISGTQLDLDKYYDLYHSKYSSINDEYKKEVAENITKDLKEYYDIADDDTTKLKNIYEQIVANFQTTEIEGLDTLSDEEYIDAVNKKLAELSWDGKIQDDYIDLTEIKVSDENSATQENDTTVDDDADTDVQTSKTKDTEDEKTTENKTQTTDDEETIKEQTATSADKETTKEDEKQIPDDLGKNPDKVYGIVENDDEVLSVAGVALEFSKEEADIKEAIQNNEEGSYELSNGTKVTLNGNNYTVEQTFDNDGTEKTIKATYNMDTNCYSETTKQDEIETYSNNKYDDEGNVVSYYKSKLEQNPDNSRTVTTFSSEGDFVAIQEKLNGGYKTSYYTDIEGKYAFNSKEAAKDASKAISAYKEAGINELSPSEKLLLGDIPSLEDVIKNIKNGSNYDIDKIVENAKTYKKDSVNLDSLEDAEKQEVYKMQEYYDMISTLGINKLTEEQKATVEKFENYYKYLNGIGNFDENIDFLTGNLRNICSSLGIEVDELENIDNNQYDKNTIFKTQSKNNNTTTTVEYNSLNGEKTTTLSIKSKDDKTTTIKTTRDENGDLSLKETTVKNADDNKESKKIEEINNLSGNKTQADCKYDSSGSPTEFTYNGTKYEVSKDDNGDYVLENSIGDKIDANSASYKYFKEHFV